MNFQKRPRSNINSRQELASIPERTLAITLDLVISFLLMLVVLLVLTTMGIKMNLNVENFLAIHLDLDFESPGMGEKIQSFMQIFFGFFPVIYSVVSTYITNGQSLGKKIVGIRVVSLHHNKLSLWHCIERSLGYIASTLELGLGFIQVLWNPNRMALHDKIGETVVIKTESAIRKENKRKLAAGKS